MKKEKLEVKSQGKSLGYVEVDIPESVEDAKKLWGDDGVVERLAQVAREDETNNARSAYLRAEKYAEDANDFIKQLRAAGKKDAEILALLNTPILCDRIPAGLVAAVKQALAPKPATAATK